MCKAFEGAEDDGSDGSLRLLQVAMVNLHGFPRGWSWFHEFGLRMFKIR